MDARVAATQGKRLTGEELVRTPDLGPCELIDGKIVPMSPTSDEHGRIEVNVAVVLKAFARSHRLGKVLGGEVGIYTRRNPDRVRAADVVFISEERYARRSNPPGYLDVSPELVVEILSPGDTVTDLAEKLREYFAIGVRLVWVVDPRARRVFAYRTPTEMREYREPDTLPAEDAVPGFTIPVSALFEE
jgi:Uma2 family endonuclease